MPAPIPFEQLLTLVEDGAVINAINDLLERKRQSEEKERIPVITILDEFIRAELAKLESRTASVDQSRCDCGPLNQLFRETIDFNK